MKGEVVVKGAPSAKFMVNDNTGAEFIVNGNTGAEYDVNGMGGVRGPKGEKGDPGAGLSISGSVNTYSELPSNLTESDAGTAYFVQADGKLYVWSGSSWPADGDGAQFQGPAGPAGADGKDGAQGPAGTNATITGATASVTNTTGTPSVTVTAGGTESARSFNFAFTNLKGEKGDTGAGLPTTGGGNNEVLVSGPNGGTDASWGKVTQKSMANNSVGTSQLINKAVTSAKIDFTTSTLWSGKYYSTGSSTAQTLSEVLELGRLYVIEVIGLSSSSWKMQFPFIYTGEKSIQFAYYDGSAYARWRISITPSASGFYLDKNSTNMSEVTAIIRFMRVM